MPLKKATNFQPVQNIAALLAARVLYYKKLSLVEKRRFENSVAGFLSRVRITGVSTTVTDEDRVLVAASGIIPIFAFPGWQYPNLNEVLLYPDTFSEEFELTSAAADRRVLGMVGSGAMNGVMILSKPALEAGFSNKTDKENTGIHEFVHLVDKTDGEADGIPELLLDGPHLKPWRKLIRDEIEKIRQNKSDINPYAATNEAEFFAVASEYFFERPALFEQKHPELYALMEAIFKQDPQSDRLQKNIPAK